VRCDMTIPMILAILLSMVLPATTPLSIDDATAAIVSTGHGNELFWYTPRVEYYLPEGVPSTVKGATNCWPPVYSGAIYINHRLPADEIPSTVMHELTHLQNDCNNTEQDAELSAMDALAYMGRDVDVIRNVIGRLQGCVDPPSHLPPAIVKVYYCDVANTMLYGDITKEYPYLLELLVDIGVRDDRYGSRR